MLTLRLFSLPMWLVLHIHRSLLFHPAPVSVVWLGANPPWSYSTETEWREPLGFPWSASWKWCSLVQRGLRSGQHMCQSNRKSPCLLLFAHRGQWLVWLRASRMCFEEQYHPDLEATLHPRGADPGNRLHHAHPWTSFKVRFCFDGRSPLKVNTFCL